jgi:hypothetical protein
MARTETTRSPLATIAGALSDLLGSVLPGWTAGEAHLAGPCARASFVELAPIDLRLEALEREIERRRRS